MTEIRLRPAHPAEAEALTELALRSKGHWGYDDTFLALCRDEMTVQPVQCNGVHLIVAEQAGTIIGYYRLDGEPPHGELADLFLEPSLIGHGHGRMLMRHAVASAGQLGHRTLWIDADPHAEAFYLRAGARRVGEVASGSIPGRMLPRLELVVPPRAAPTDRHRHL